MRTAVLGLAACLAVGMSCAWAQDLKLTEKHSETALGFELGGGYRNFTLTVMGPNGFHASTTSENTAPSIDLRQAGARDDGVYTYRLTAARKSDLDNGRPEGAKESMMKGVSVNGQVHLKGGTIQKFAAAEHEGEKTKRPPRERK